MIPSKNSSTNAEAKIAKDANKKILFIIIISSQKEFAQKSFNFFMKNYFESIQMCLFGYNEKSDQIISTSNCK